MLRPLPYSLREVRQYPKWCLCVIGCKRCPPDSELCSTAGFSVPHRLRFSGCVTWKNEYSGRHVNKTELATEKTQACPDARFPRTLREHFGQERLDSPPPERTRKIDGVTSCHAKKVPALTCRLHAPPEADAPDSRNVLFPHGDPCSSSRRSPDGVRGFQKSFRPLGRPQQDRAPLPRKHTPHAWADEKSGSARLVCQAGSHYCDVQGNPTGYSKTS